MIETSTSEADCIFFMQQLEDRYQLSQEWAYNDNVFARTAARHGRAGVLKFLQGKPGVDFTLDVVQGLDGEQE